jgi:DeoR/GlpR family transcriptional regulator of sugar metabolism
MCHRVVAVLDATKWGRAGLASFADLTDVDKILTDADAPADLVASVRDLGIDVLCV